VAAVHFELERRGTTIAPTAVYTARSMTGMSNGVRARIDNSS
jgi:hypothetical protein